MVIGQPYRLSELKGTRALEQDLPYLNGQGEALVAFAGLGMGDGAAVDIAVESHRGVLQHAGVFILKEDMIYH